MAHEHIVTDSDKHFIIDPATREITNAQSEKKIIMQYDHDSERFSFEIPRYVEGHDMLVCNKVEVHYANSSSGGKQQNTGVYVIEDFDVSADDETKVVGTWLISENATMYAGALNFLILFACVDEEDVVVYRWHTNINKTVSVVPGMNNSESVTESLPDIVETWKDDIYGTNFAYEAALKYGYEGTEEEWVNSIDANIGLSNYVTSDALTSMLSTYVSVEAQTFTEEQQAQARTNIGASKFYWGEEDAATYFANNNITPVTGTVYFQIS